MSPTNDKKVVGVFVRFRLPLAKQSTSVKPDFATVTGIYKDSWFGNVTITEKESYSLNLRRSSQLRRSFFYKRQLCGKMG
jgi:hypothetical protein